MKNILITGSTGTLGSFCVKYLLENTSLHLYCLVRSPSKEEGLKKQIYAINAYGIILNKSVYERLHIILGDVEKSNLGIDENEIVQLRSQIDCIVHMAANVSFFADSATLHKNNIVSTEHIVAFAKSCHQAKLIFTSSYSVHGKNKSQVMFTEDNFDIGQSFDNIPYPHSKFNSEKVIRDSFSDKSQYIILRPGNIFGDSITGRFPFYTSPGNDIFYNLIKAAVETQYAAELCFHFDITPVDYVIKTIALILTKDVFWSETLHLFNPDMMPFKKMIGLLKHVGYPIKMISLNKYRELISENKLLCHGAHYSSVITKMFLVYYHSFMQEGPFSLSCNKTVSLLKKHQITCPAIKNLLPVYYQFCIAVGYLISPDMI